MSQPVGSGGKPVVRTLVQILDWVTPAVPRACWWRSHIPTAVLPLPCATDALVLHYYPYALQDRVA